MPCSMPSGEYYIGSDVAPSSIKLRFDIFNIMRCWLPSVLRERTKEFKKYFDKPEIGGFSVSEDKLKAFEGYYQLQGRESAFIKFEVKGCQLIVTSLVMGNGLLLRPLSECEFYCKEFLFFMKFIKDKSGEVIEVLANGTLYKKTRIINLLFGRQLPLHPHNLKLLKENIGIIMVL
jgi:hypothetical protein